MGNIPWQKNPLNGQTTHAKNVASKNNGKSKGVLIKAGTRPFFLSAVIAEKEQRISLTRKLCALLEFRIPILSQDTRARNARCAAPMAPKTIIGLRGTSSGMKPIVGLSPIFARLAISAGMISSPQTPMALKRHNPAVKTAPLRYAGTPLKRRPLPLR